MLQSPSRSSYLQWFLINFILGPHLTSDDDARDAEPWVGKGFC